MPITVPVEGPLSHRGIVVGSVAVVILSTRAIGAVVIEGTVVVVPVHCMWSRKVLGISTGGRFCSMRGPGVRTTGVAARANVPNKLPIKTKRRLKAEG
jgi:hypothetical protein